MQASPINEMALKHLRDADSFSEMSVALHLVAEGNVLGTVPLQRISVSDRR